MVGVGLAGDGLADAAADGVVVGAPPVVAVPADGDELVAGVVLVLEAVSVGGGLDADVLTEAVLELVSVGPAELVEVADGAFVEAGLVGEAAALGVAVGVLRPVRVGGADEAMGLVVVVLGDALVGVDDALEVALSGVQILAGPRAVGGVGGVGDLGETPAAWAVLSGLAPAVGEVPGEDAAAVSADAMGRAARVDDDDRAVVERVVLGVEAAEGSGARELRADEAVADAFAIALVPGAAAPGVVSEFDGVLVGGGAGDPALLIVVEGVGVAAEELAADEAAVAVVLELEELAAVAVVFGDEVVGAAVLRVNESWEMSLSSHARRSPRTPDSWCAEHPFGRDSRSFGRGW